MWVLSLAGVIGGLAMFFALEWSFGAVPSGLAALLTGAVPTGGSRSRVDRSHSSDKQTGRSEVGDHITDIGERLLIIEAIASC